MKTLLRSLLILSAFGILAGCGSNGDTLTGDDGNDDDNGGDDDELPAVYLFDEDVWPTGGRFNPFGTPPFDIRGQGVMLPFDVPVGGSDPSWEPVVPRDSDDMRYLGWASSALNSGQIDAITGAFNSGFPTDQGDLMLIPTIARFTPPGETYRFFQMSTQDLMVKATGTYESGRTQVVGIAFGNGQGGYMPVAPYTEDTFAGALVWMKATKHPVYDTWSLDQRDWTKGTGASYATSLRLLMRGSTAIAIILESELIEIGATRVRWDSFSFKGTVDNEWSHDYTDWEDLDWD